jgi:hypothetical protein
VKGEGRGEGERAGGSPRKDRKGLDHHSNPSDMGDLPKDIQNRVRPWIVEAR